MPLDGNQIPNDNRVLGYPVIGGRPADNDILKFNGTQNIWEYIQDEIGDITGGASLGAGEAVFASEIAGILNFKSLTASADILLTGTADEIAVALSVAFLARMTAIDAAIALNTAKVTNATHTGEVTGATATVLDKSAISNKSVVTAVAADYVLIGDTSDSDNLKKSLVSDFLGGSVTENTNLEVEGITKTLGQWILIGL
jgi:hypothetical protein